MDDVLPTHFNTPVGNWPNKLGLQLRISKSVQVMYNMKLYWRDVTFYADSLEFTPINHLIKADILDCIAEGRGVDILPTIAITARVIRTYSIACLVDDKDES